mmetsp:Transcript_5441/g.8031  ORF Transcript_5441/g.8031 Transcript_5441/m.8031 type:complete len:126 (+) Transcript_5441:24-401(+)
MGRRKSKAVVRKPKRGKVATIFDCPFCNEVESVKVYIDQSNQTGNISCRECLASYSTKIHKLSAPIDVFTEWIDESLAAQENHQEEVNDYDNQDESNYDNNKDYNAEQEDEDIDHDENDDEGIAY